MSISLNEDEALRFFGEPILTFQALKAGEDYTLLEGKNLLYTICSYDLHQLTLA